MEVSNIPVERGVDSEGSFYRWGKKGKKYRYKEGVIKQLFKIYKKVEKST